MQLTVASWNIRDCLADPDMPQRIVDLGADIVVLPEAYKEADSAAIEQSGAINHLVGAGYRVYQIPYDDDDGRQDRHVLVVVTRRTAEVEAARVAGRTMAVIRLDGLVVAGVHLDDRDDARRVGQLGMLLGYLHDASRLVVLGDFNAAYPGTTLASVLCRLRPVTDWLPVGEPGTQQSKPARIGSLTRRLRMMLSSGAMDVARCNHLVDADGQRWATMMLGGVPLVQLDHIMTRGVRVLSFRRPRVAGSDHLPILAEIEWR